MQPTSDMQPAAPCYSTATGENSVIGDEGCRVRTYRVNGRRRHREQTQRNQQGTVGNGITREGSRTVSTRFLCKSKSHTFEQETHHGTGEQTKGGDTPCNDVKEREVAITGAQAAAIKKFRRERGGAAAMV
ncbi:hypothetical protein FB45DRAFT_864427 [Roridomyces roridus]|uniref:Uncharacterized protein n=1 Tax=Roridomyces roridus TaxID=1738132 RepID=A0AAD7C1D0_9AGAR|nr:hypothetical protein FB45DRAFT_864427 [Roridomyces roridus]